MYAAGYDLKMGPDAPTLLIDEFEQAAGEPPSFFHLNDSAGELGSNTDRHMLIGEGKIGVEPFRWLLGDRRTAGVPLVLETPQQNYEIADDDPSPDPWDDKMVRLLTSFVGRD
jgi:deoxyribonuclease-4